MVLMIELQIQVKERLSMVSNSNIGRQKAKNARCGVYMVYILLCFYPIKGIRKMKPSYMERHKGDGRRKTSKENRPRRDSNHKPTSLRVWERERIKCSRAWAA